MSVVGGPLADLVASGRWDGGLIFIARGGTGYPPSLRARSEIRTGAFLCPLTVPGGAPTPRHRYASMSRNSMPYNGGGVRLVPERAAPPARACASGGIGRRARFRS